MSLFAVIGNGRELVILVLLNGSRPWSRRARYALPSGLCFARRNL